MLVYDSIYMNKAKPIIARKVTLSDKIERKLEDRIMSGEWEVGFKLPSEGKLCEEFGVSRTAVREALKELRGRGIIHTARGSGSYVSGGCLDMVSQAMSAYSNLSVDEKSATDLIEFRAMIEGAALQRLARFQNNYHADILAMEEILQKMNSDISTEQFCELDTKFHVTVLKACDNAFITMIAEVLYDKYLHSHGDTPELITKAMRDATVEEHAKILDTVKSGAALDAVEALEGHLKAAEARGKVLGQ